MKKKIYQRPALEVEDVHVESQLMAGSNGIQFGGSADDEEWGAPSSNIWAE